MHRLLKTSAFMMFLALLLAGCSGQRKPASEKGSMLSNLPFVYKMTVQQGNLITEDMVDRLEPGMTRAQVRYLLGTPLLTDLFHSDRWDYPYMIRRGHCPPEERKLTLYFDGDALIRIQGQPQPDPSRLAEASETRDIMVEVPDWKDNRGLINKTLNAVGVKTQD